MFDSSWPLFQCMQRLVMIGQVPFVDGRLRPWHQSLAPEGERSTKVSSCVCVFAETNCFADSFSQTWASAPFALEYDEYTDSNDYDCYATNEATASSTTTTTKNDATTASSSSASSSSQGLAINTGGGSSSSDGSVSQSLQSLLSDANVPQLKDDEVSHSPTGRYSPPIRKRSRTKCLTLPEPANTKGTEISPIQQRTTHHCMLT